MMKPVKIRYMGLIPMTRRSYLLSLLVIGCVVGVFLLVTFILFGDRYPKFRLPWEPLPIGIQPTIQNYLYFNVWSGFLLCMIAQIIDTTVMLQKFRRKEEEQEALQDMTHEHFDH